jgi:2-polyprenyl-3-methyl-5-hydroxy-6-metoxy-1,4-benzoquinol methylase
MLPRDIGLFLKSARTDARIEKLRAEVGAAAALETVYAEGGDPWASASPRYRYQRRKYEVLASLLPERRFSRALDLGCGVGLMCRHLAARADAVLGVDIAPSAIKQAATHNADLPQVSYACHDITALPESLDGGFDLVVVADVLYYLSPLPDALLKAMAQRVARLLRPGGMVLLANHYFFSADPESRRSRRIHDAFGWSPGLQRRADFRRAFYIATLLDKAD